jgi:hypothetical protein
MNIERWAPLVAGLEDTATSAFARDGFVVARGVVPPEELEPLRALYDQLFENRAGWERGDLFDMLDPEDRLYRPRLPQLAWPSRQAPWLRGTATWRNAQAAASSLLPGAELVWEFAIMKPPRDGAATPWHQDEASFTVGTPYHAAVSCWIALQDVDEQMGAWPMCPAAISDRCLTMPASVATAAHMHWARSRPISQPRFPCRSRPAMRCCTIRGRCMVRGPIPP